MFSTVLKSLMPRETKFFDLFRDSADLIVEGAQELVALAKDPSQVDVRAKKISEIEHKADGITHKTVALLHQTFITPIDREDIHQLISRMDDILDFMEAASERILLYQIDKTTPEMVRLSEICLDCAKFVKLAVVELDNLKKPEEILKHCIELNRLENEADQVLRRAMATLFRDEKDTRQLIKLKELYELLETVTDRCEDVANIIEGIVLEYA